ncbi:MAG: aryl-sulfate sulfotransferase [Planctomycetes bacterium]|nr:aryl-sulfate sulfotransferase [Planctomycetota bacterium]
MLVSFSRILATAVLGSGLAAQADGLRIYQTIASLPTRLVDTAGNIVHSWPGIGIQSSHVAPDGTMLRGMFAPAAGAITAGGATGRIQRMAFDGTVLWDYYLDGPQLFAHHDVESMPNGNVLLIAWDQNPLSVAVANGRDPALITGSVWWPDAIVEVQATGPTAGTIVWEWHMMDHVIQDFDPLKPNYGPVASHPELLDINYPPMSIADGDWNHFNGLDYDPINDWIVVSARSQDEIYIIDHSTTTAEAASHSGGLRGKGGDFLYRWGNPEAYRAGTVAHKQLGAQHDPRFVPPGYPGAGNVTIFNNDYLPLQSSAVEIVLPPLDSSGNFILDPSGRYGPVAPHWMWTAPGFYSQYISSTERLPNGNTLICSGLQNYLIEVTPAGQIAWTYHDPISPWIFQASWVDRNLWGDTELSASGGQLDFDHLVGSPYAGYIYLLLGSVSGTSPGTPIPGGLTVPLVADYLLAATATSYSGIFVNTIGLLGPNGEASSSIVVPPGFVPPSMVGTHLDFAHVIFNSSLLPVRVSNATGATIVP